MKLMGPETSARINTLVTMAISKSIHEGSTVRLEIVAKLESIPNLREHFESVIKAWQAEEHEGLWVGALQNYRWSIELEFVAI